MGFLDSDAVSNLSGRTSHNSKPKKHYAGHGHHKVVIKRRSRSRSRNRDRDRDDDHHHRDRDADHHHRRRDSDGSEKKKKKKHGSRSHSRSRSRNRFRDSTAAPADALGDDDWYDEAHGGSKHDRGLGSLLSKSASTFFGLGNGSRSSFFGLGRPSYYKRSSRHGLVHHMVKKLKRLVHDLVEYAKTHPLKVLSLVLVPLVAGGALTALLARAGIRLPSSVERLIGVATKIATGDSVGLVGEAVRAFGGGGGGDGGRGGSDGSSTSVRVARGHTDGVRWERREVHGVRNSSPYDEWDYGSGGGDGSWGDGIRKMFY